MLFIYTVPQSTCWRRHFVKNFVIYLELLFHLFCLFLKMSNIKKIKCRLVSIQGWILRDILSLSVFTAHVGRVHNRSGTLTPANIPFENGDIFSYSLVHHRPIEAHLFAFSEMWYKTKSIWSLYSQREGDRAVERSTGSDLLLNKHVI